MKPNKEPSELEKLLIKLRKLRENRTEYWARMSATKDAIKKISSGKTTATAALADIQRKHPVSDDLEEAVEEVLLALEEYEYSSCMEKKS